MSHNKPSSKPRPAARPRAAEISAARAAAFRILLAVDQSQAHSDTLLRGDAVSALSAPDRNLATALVLGVLRWQIRLDHQLRAFLARPNARLEPEVRVALRMGAFQLLHMDRIPARAAIDQSVELTKHAGHRFAAPMVNAVLRKLAAAPHSTLPESIASELALAYAHPAWMVERWEQTFGIEAAHSICAHGQARPSITVRLSTESTEAELVREGIRAEPGNLLTTALSISEGDITTSQSFTSSSVRIQDEGSQLVAEIAAAQLHQEQSSILDACAAPGGKTLILAERHKQARIVAVESSPPRLEQLRQRLTPYADRIECRLGNAEDSEESAYDLVLADVPCSGTGTLGRNPEIRHRLSLEDLPRQAERQIAILSAALGAARPGGRVVYSTCSLEPEENQQVVAAALAANPNACAVSLAPTLDALEARSILMPQAAADLRAALTPAGTLALLPGRFPTDGFFIAILEKSL